MKRLLPPLMVDWLQSARRAIHPIPAEWEYLPDGWSTNNDNKIKGWSDPSIPKCQHAKWQEFLRATEGTRLLGIAHEALSPTNKDFDAHHIIMTYAYVLALAAHKKHRLSLLDWGGGIGHYLVLSRRLMPELDIEYFCKDLPSLCRVGREVLPEARLVDCEEEAARRGYDLVLAIGSLQYAESWKSAVQFIGSVADGYVYVTRLPVVRHSASFVAIQRLYAYGYDTECMGWIFNRDEFLDEVLSQGLELVREFALEKHPMIRKGKEQPEIQGFLLRSKGTSRPCISE